MAGGAIISWFDYRNSSETSIDCYVQRVYADGHVGGDTLTQIDRRQETARQGSEIEILEIYPNPSNLNVTFKFNLISPGNLEILIFDVQGKRIKSLNNRSYSAGNLILKWDGKNNKGKQLSGGLYFVSINYNGIRTARKVLLLK